jgi:excisionase family DNA binding protein
MVKTLDLLTVEEVAELLRLTPYTIRRLLNEGKLPGRKIGGGRQWRIDKGELAHYLKRTADVGSESVNVDAPTPISIANATSLMSEDMLARDWLRPEEDEAWAHL